MFEFEVLTVRDLDFVDNRNHPVKGRQIWVIGPSSSSGWRNWQVLKLWFPDSSSFYVAASSLQRGDRIFVTFDFNGKASGFELIKS